MQLLVLLELRHLTAPHIKHIAQSFDIVTSAHMIEGTLITKDREPHDVQITIREEAGI